jgi:hypothetical protein
MKKAITIALVLLLALSLAACGGSSNNDTPTGSSGDIDINAAAENLVEDAIEGDAFSEAAAMQALGNRGIEKSAIEPDWAYTIDESKMTTYGDTSHGSVEFIKTDGEISDEEYQAWLKKVFDATAAASDDGHNIQGFAFGNGDVEKTWDEIANNESFMLVWSYKYNDTIMDVYPECKEDPDRESEVITNEETGSWEIVYHYKSVAVDIATGLQKSFDETMKDAEAAFEEHGDEIEDALRDAAN